MPKCWQVHHGVLIYNKITQDTWITEREWERKKNTLMVGFFFQKRQKLNSTSFPSKQNPAISGMTSLVSLAIAYILAHWVCLVSPKWESHHLEALALSSPQGASAKATTTCAGAELGGLRLDTILSCTTCCFSSLPTDCMLGYSQALGEHKANSRQCYLIKVTSQGKNSRSSNNAT